MTNNLFIYNTLSRKKERFEPLNPPFVGLYACGPTVYGDAHLGHARQAITFDVLYRYLTHLGFKVRYVRNITDVGHLEHDADEGEDKILKKARIESLEPMEVVQRYLNRYHDNMRQLNLIPPSIEPMASGHVIEQQQLVRKILDAGYAYEKNGSVYFDMARYTESHPYGQLSGRKVGDLLANTRPLDGQSEKNNPLDFALWKKAGPAHLMKWPSAWGDGYPGWHLECSVMSTRYLGIPFDIHGGGMDLLFPHHECEIAQNVAGYGEPGVKYWMHNNMITINGQKMGRSLGNFITLDEIFSGNHRFLDQAYSPQTIRFYILQAHYRSTLDFSNQALQASEKGMIRLLRAAEMIGSLPAGSTSTVSVDDLAGRCREAMNDDLNTPVLISHLYEGVKWINEISEGRRHLTRDDLEKLRELFDSYLYSVLGLERIHTGAPGEAITDELIGMILQLRGEAKTRRDFETADRIRDGLRRMGVVIKDKKDGADWEFSKDV
ncbi:MAG TPA: cysteine--tRNA ligase [Bacteroides sp.]|nr:cysteine--tRNA ligase [Bacteroides sp.]